jgi:photosystem II stability/assembly factor-like uncharacterized protein
MHLRLPLCLIAALCLASLITADDVKPVPAEYKNFKFRNVGPAAGGRVCRACGVPGDPNTYYAAASAGGLWKSTDGGHSWKAITDDVELSSVGSIAVAPSDPNVIYLGSGEANIRGNVDVGNGIWKSTDAGKTWKHVWKQEGQIGTMIVHPTDPKIAFAAVLGRAFGKDREGEQRGVWRTTDGGQSWKCVRPKNKVTGASDVCFDPSNPSILFAGLWEARRQPWGMTSGGPGSGLYVSRDGGDSWTQLLRTPDDDPDKTTKGVKYCKGLPEWDGKTKVWGKIGVAVAPSDSKRVYALIEAEKGGLFRSDDGGDTWDRVNPSRALQQRAWYYSTLTVHPKNADVVYFPQVPLLVTRDGGKTFDRIKGPHHGDHHDVWIDPKNTDRMINSNDGGVDISTDGGKSWFAPPLPISQFYHVSVDNHVPYRIAGTMQDIGSCRGPSNSLLTSGIPLSAWLSVGGGEAGHVACDPKDPNVVYAGEYMGYISRWDFSTRQAKSIGVYPYNASGIGAKDLKYRFQWTAPIVVSPHSSKIIYHAANVLFKTTDAGMNWEAISDDLTRGRDKESKDKLEWSGGPITGDNTGVEVYCTIFAVAESPKQKGLIWAGTDDGKVWVTEDGGKDKKNWQDVTAALTKAGLPEWATICCIEPSPFEEKKGAVTAYVVADAHKNDDRAPYLFVTSDTGKTWKRLSDPKRKDNPFPDLGYLQVVRVDPTDKNLLYVGGEYGLVFSRDAGATWERLKLNMPTVRVTDLVVKDNDLVVGTNGRSIWIFDDLTPLRTAPKDWGTLLKPCDAYRFRYESPVTERRSASNAPNPPNGALIHYRLDSKAKEVTLEILKDDKVIRTLTSKKIEVKDPDKGSYSAITMSDPLPVEKGLHRVVWDLRYKGAFLISGGRVDGGRPDRGPLANPGKYAVRLTVVTEKGAKIAKEEFEVKEEPRLTEKVKEELKEQLDFALKIRNDVTRVAVTAEKLRGVRKQLLEREALLKGDNRWKGMAKEVEALKKALDELEEKLHNPKAETSYDILAKGPAKVYSQLAWLFELVKDADGAPTQGVRAIYDEQRKLVGKYEKDWEALVDKELKAFNAIAQKQNVPTVIVPPVKEPATDGKPNETRKASRWGR